MYTNLYICVAILIIILIVIMCVFREKFTQGMIMTLGDYGKPTPEMCNETSPEIRKIPPSEGRPFVACNACSLVCSDPTNCYECQQKLNYAGVL